MLLFLTTNMAAVTSLVKQEYEKVGKSFIQVFEVAREGFSGLIPPKFGHKLRHQWVIASFRCYDNSDVIPPWS